MTSNTRSEYFKNKVPGKTYVSSRQQRSRDQRHFRIASKVEVNDEAQHFAEKKDELIIRLTPGYKYEWRATFTEDDRNISVLTVQRYGGLSGGYAARYVHFDATP